MYTASVTVTIDDIPAVWQGPHGPVLQKGRTMLRSSIRRLCRSGFRRSVVYLDRNAPPDPELVSGCYPSVRAFNNSLFISSLPKISISPLAKKNGINTTNISSMVAKTPLGSATVSEKLAAKD
jgi:hypothetical protein